MLLIVNMLFNSAKGGPTLIHLFPIINGSRFYSTSTVRSIRKMYISLDLHETFMTKYICETKNVPFSELSNIHNYVV